MTLSIKPLNLPCGSINATQRTDRHANAVRSHASALREDARHRPIRTVTGVAGTSFGQLICFEVKIVEHLNM